MTNKLKTITTKQSFKDVIENKLFYVDKTKQIHTLITTQSEVFLKRPRRFGKSMLISTLHELFSGNKELFKDLYICKNTTYEFEEFPVIYISFANYNKNFNNHLYEYIDKTIIISYQKSNYSLKNFGFKSSKDPLFSLGELIKEVYKKFNKKVVLLVDEYDKIATENFNDDNIQKYVTFIESLYDGVKDANGLGYMRFTLISGLTKVLLTDMLSTLNHLNDISNDYKFHDICGYTKKEIIDNFHTHENDYLSLLSTKKGTTTDVQLQNIKNFYNGYNFGIEDDLIYNPYSVNLLFDKLEYNYYWSDTGRASLIVNYLKNSRKEDYQEALDLILEGDVDTSTISQNILTLQQDGSGGYRDILNILYITGYLTSKDGHLTFPNKEAEFSVRQDLIKLAYAGNPFMRDIMLNTGSYLYKGILELGFSENFDKAMKNLNTLMDGTVHQWTYKNPEGIYKFAMYNCLFTSLSPIDYHVIAEDSNSRGYADIIVLNPRNSVCIIIEAKGSEVLDGAVEQANKYLDFYVSKGYKHIYLFGTKYNTQEKNIEKLPIKYIQY